MDAAAVPSRCMVVIGHVDHGKTTLVHALTGMHTDTLTEERARGLSIMPGFAHCAIGGGVLDLIDVPGHEDFIRAMVCGASGAGAAMLVVSAADGIAAQTREHLRIVSLLGLRVALVVATKVDLVPAQDLAGRLRDIRADLASMPGATPDDLAQVPIIPCSPRADDGLGPLRAALADVMALPATDARPLAPFLPIDRAFSAQGRGTVVTGTLLGAGVAQGDTLTLFPAGGPATIRGVQVRGHARPRAAPGERVALNLRGVDVGQVPRGTVLGGLLDSGDAAFAATNGIDVALNLLASATVPLKHMQQLRVLFGTNSVVATLRITGGGQIAPGQAGFGHLHFKEPVTAFAGQRAILRRLSPPQTLGGATVLDPQATPAKSGDRLRLGVLQAAAAGKRPVIATALCAAGRGTARLADIVRLSRQPVEACRRDLDSGFADLEGGLVARQQDLDSVEADLLENLRKFHATFPLKPFAPPSVSQHSDYAPELVRQVAALLANRGTIRVEETGTALADHDPWLQMTEAQRARLNQIETALRDGALIPPDPIIPALNLSKPATAQGDTEAADLLVLLVTAGRVVMLRNVALDKSVAFHADALDQARDQLRAHFPPPATFRTGDARSALGTTRKFIVPLLEYFDSQGVTLRNGDLRQMAGHAQ